MYTIKTGIFEKELRNTGILIGTLNGTIQALKKAEATLKLH